MLDLSVPSADLLKHSREKKPGGAKSTSRLSDSHSFTPENQYVKLSVTRYAAPRSIPSGGPEDLVEAEAQPWY